MTAMNIAGLTEDQKFALLGFRPQRPIPERPHAPTFPSSYGKSLLDLARTEEESVVAWEEILTPHFDVSHEVKGRHYSGKTVRVDMLLHPKFSWSAGSRTPIGFEIKRYNANQNELVGQAVDYANSVWCRWSNDTEPPRDSLFIAVYAPRFANGGNEDPPGLPISMPEQFLGRLGVAMFHFTEWEGLELRVSGNLVWNERRGVCRTRWSAARKFGSR